MSSFLLKDWQYSLPTRVFMYIVDKVYFFWNLSRRMQHISSKQSVCHFHLPIYCQSNGDEKLVLWVDINKDGYIGWREFHTYIWDCLQWFFFSDQLSTFSWVALIFIFPRIHQQCTLNFYVKNELGHTNIAL